MNEAPEQDAPPPQLRPSKGAQHVAQRLDLTYISKIGKEERARLAKLALLPKPTEVRHLMRGEIANRGLTAFQHTYILPAGQVVIPVVSTVYMAQAPSAWPKTTIAPTNVWRRALRWLYKRSHLALDLDAFNRAFAVQTRNPEFAVLLLTPELQTHLLDKKRRLKWIVGEGAIRLIYPGKMRPDRIERSLARLGRFCELLPPELDAWRDADTITTTAPV